MLAKARWWPLRARALAVEPDGVRHRLGGAGNRNAHLLNELAGRKFSVVEDVRECVERAARNAAPLELVEPFADGSRAKDLLEEFGERRLILRAKGNAGEARIVQQRVLPGRLAHFTP
jgi:hypothetical protein